MLETLLKILSWDIYPPNIMLETDKDSMFYNTLSLDWFDPMCSVSIEQNGIINWADEESGYHGNDFERLKIILESREQ